MFGLSLVAEVERRTIKFIFSIALLSFILGCSIVYILVNL